MHELGIVFHIIDTVEQVGRENGVTQVRCVTLDVGQVSGIEDPYLMDCWRWAADRSEMLRGARLQIETVHAVTLCDACGKTYEMTPTGYLKAQEGDTEFPIVAAGTPTCCKAMHAVFEKLRRDRECTS